MYKRQVLDDARKIDDFYRNYSLPPNESGGKGESRSSKRRKAAAARKKETRAAAVNTFVKYRCFKCDHDGHFLKDCPTATDEEKKVTTWAEWKKMKPEAGDKKKYKRGRKSARRANKTVEATNETASTAAATDEIICHECKKPGHKKAKCPNVKCRTCDEMGHHHRV